MKSLTFILFLLFTIFLLSAYTFVQAQSIEDKKDTTTNEPLSSELVLSVSYSSKALIAGRDGGVSQSSILPSIGYFHKSGIWANVSGFLLSNTEPNYNSTNFSVGFDGNFTQDFTYSLSYGYNYFTPSDEESQNLIPHSLGAYLNYDFNYINLGTGYTLLFGEDTGHRWNIDIGSYFPIYTESFIRKITIAPTFSFVFANENIVINRLPERLLRRFPNGIEENNFGLMNMDLVVPVSFYIGDFRLLVSYNLALPQKINDLRPFFDRTDYSAKHFWGLGFRYTIR